ncbi:MAG: phosphoglucosamine mutase [Armatimonadetes bacterium]|nr:phosphoglucosamine mutase [Armatimonadota bacterium]
MSNHFARRYFGTDGIRGVANRPPLDPQTLVRMGKAVASVFLKRAGKRHRILIGRDTRLSGDLIETALSAGLTCMGADVLLIGPVPTPGIAYLTWSMRADAGIVISASHNPFEDNGFKLFGHDGFKLPDEVEMELESLLESPEMDSRYAEPSAVGRAIHIGDAIGRYTVFLKSWFPRELTLEGVKIGVDCAHGAAYEVAPQTFTELGADVSAIGVSPNGRNINAGCGSLHPEAVGRLVREEGLDIGIALDGDGDRCVLVDEQGRTYDGDAVLAMCAVDLKERGLLPESRVVATVMSNLGLDIFLRERGIEVEHAPVGDRYVLEAMVRTGCRLGAEPSGHVIFRDMTTTGDGLLTALNVLAVMGRLGRPLSEIASQVKKFPQILMNVKVARKPPLDTIEPVRRLIREKEAILDGRGRILVRYSGTENKARVMVECEDSLLCESAASEIAEAIRDALGEPS